MLHVAGECALERPFSATTFAENMLLLEIPGGPVLTRLVLPALDGQKCGNICFYVRSGSSTISELSVVATLTIDGDGNVYPGDDLLDAWEKTEMGYSCSDIQSLIDTVASARAGRSPDRRE